MFIPILSRLKGLLVPSMLALAVLPVSLSLALTTPSSNPPDRSPANLDNPILLAQKSRTRRIRFAPGRNYTIVKDAVIRGTRDIYLLGAQKGQTMTVKIESVESNAVFDLMAPPNQTGQSRTIKQEAVSWNSKLPETGDYQIVVGSTRGNATYRLKVVIQ
ncbi:hypothetical protein K9N68_02015 [Kovacikia minuta CCNUW1]|uniref:hypothetical protein n=1 Tax=Kovacikia minuta TaxID=2931930 RepID=UPI001CCD21B1|nr:hypothetical protein [Kovacikia minuta]UBF26793.1 hypothetical protein K9N68_02015 [Kovacikia minuta CCNUW1]